VHKSSLIQQDNQILILAQPFLEKTICRQQRTSHRLNCSLWIRSRCHYLLLQFCRYGSFWFYEKSKELSFVLCIMVLCCSSTMLFESGACSFDFNMATVKESATIRRVFFLNLYPWAVLKQQSPSAWRNACSVHALKHGIVSAKANAHGHYYSLQNEYLSNTAEMAWKQRRQYGNK
jgi:hypothetical protein